MNLKSHHRRRVVCAKWKRELLLMNSPAAEELTAQPPYAIGELEALRLSARQKLVAAVDGHAARVGSGEGAKHGAGDLGGGGLTKWIAQKQECGCTVAAVAMVVGASYEKVAAHSTRDFDNDGVQIEDWCDFLFERGFTFHRVYRVTHLQGVNKERTLWPPEPFAPIHLCSVLSSVAAHAVVMLANGAVLDPAHWGIHQLSEYREVHFVLGLYRKPEER